MRLQLLSDLHLESQALGPIAPAPGADVLLLAGDIDARWEGYDRFAAWPVPVYAVAGNHEFDRRDLDEARAALGEHLRARGIRLLERESVLLEDGRGGRARLLATTRWTDFDAFGAEGRGKAMRAAAHHLRIMDARRHGRPFDAVALRAEALVCRAWLAEALREPAPEGIPTVVLTHHAPSLRCADPRYGLQPTTAGFCNSDDALLPRADLWLHGHLHCRHALAVPREGAPPARVVCAAHGLQAKGEAAGWRAEDGVILLAAAPPGGDPAGP